MLAVVSCGGLGTRLGYGIPKCLVRINDRTLIDYQMDLLRDFSQVCVVTGYKSEQVEQHLDSLGKDVKIVVNDSFESTDNSYAIYLATRNHHGPFVAIDGDLIVGKKSFGQFLGSAPPDKDLFSVTNRKTSDPILVDYDEQAGEVLRFSFNDAAKHEWCGLTYFGNYRFHEDGNYRFKGYRHLLPVKAHHIDAYEIDTPADLSLAINNIARLDY